MIDCYSSLEDEYLVNNSRDSKSIQKNKNSFSSLAGWEEGFYNDSHFDQQSLDFSYEKTFSVPSENSRIRKEGERTDLGNEGNKSKNITTTDLPFVSRLSLYMEEKKQEIRNLKNIKKAIYQDIKETTDKKKAVLTELENLTNQQRNMLTFFQWYSNLKPELQNKYNIIIKEEFEYFVKAINDFKSYNYDIHLLLKDYRKIESLRQETRSIQDVINIRSPLKDILLNEVSRLNDQISYLKHTINTYYQLYNAGFGLKELKQLSSTIMEISLAKNISMFEAVSKFLKDIEDQYDNKLGFEAKVNELESQMEKLKDEVPEYKYYLQLQGVVGPVLNHLSINGVTNEDIIGINHLVSEFKNSDFLSDPIHRNKDNKILGNNTVKTTYQYWVLFTQKLKELKNINSGINKQTVNLNTLIVQYDNLERKKHYLK